MEQRKRLGVMVFIWVLLSAWLQIPHVMGDEFTDVFIDELTTGARMGCGDMAPCGMDNYRLDKKDWSREEYFDCVKTKGAYQELRGLPNQWWVAHPSDEVVDIVWLLPKEVDVEYVQYIFDKAIYDYDNYCPSGTEKGFVVTVLFVEGELLRNLIKKYHEKTGVRALVFMTPAINAQHKEFFEYIIKELRFLEYIIKREEDKVGNTKYISISSTYIVTKLLLKSDSSYEQDVNKLFGLILLNVSQQGQNSY